MNGVLKTEVKNGRLVLEPTDLPEGRVVELMEADSYSVLHPNAEERERINAMIEQSRRDSKAGLGVPLETVLEELEKI